MPLKSKSKTKKASTPKRERTRSRDSLERLVRRPCRRTFNGIQFTHVGHGVWKTDDGIELLKGNILVKWDRWSVEHNPRVTEHWSDGTPKSREHCPHGLRSTGFTAIEALTRAGLAGVGPKTIDGIGVT